MHQIATHAAQRSSNARIMPAQLGSVLSKGPIQHLVLSSTVKRHQTMTVVVLKSSSAMLTPVLLATPTVLAQMLHIAQV
jgi:hypothetical protein